jgi:hypothetical protein
VSLEALSVCLVVDHSGRPLSSGVGGGLRLSSCSTRPGTKSASCPQIGRKAPIGGLTGIRLKRAVAPEVGRGSVCARSGGIVGSGFGFCWGLGAWLRRLIWVVGRLGGVGLISGHAYRFCITPIPHCRATVFGVCQGGKDALTNSKNC